MNHSTHAQIPQVTKAMKAKKRAKRNKLKPFVKVVNYNHIMPTRYSLDVVLDKELVAKSKLKDPVSLRSSFLSGFFSFQWV